MRILLTLIIIGAANFSDGRAIKNQGSEYYAFLPDGSWNTAAPIQVQYISGNSSPIITNDYGYSPYELCLNLDSQLEDQIFVGNYVPSGWNQYSLNSHGGDIRFSTRNFGNDNRPNYLKVEGIVRASTLGQSTSDITPLDPNGNYTPYQWGDRTTGPYASSLNSGYFAFRILSKESQNHYGWFYWDGTNFTDYVVNLTPEQHIVVGDTSLVDNDDDLLPDDWEVSNFGSIASTSGNLDSDGDYYTNYEELTLGTDPNVPDFKIWQVPAIELYFEALSNHTYQVQYAVDLVNGVWSNYGVSVVGDGSTNTMFLTTQEASNRVFRVIQDD
jgi:hypothetical protein